MAAKYRKIKGGDVLDQDDKQRIYEEEKARLEAHEKLKGEKKKQGCIGCLALIVIFAVIGLIMDSCSGDKSKESGKTTNTPPQQQTQQQSSIPGTLGMTPNEFTTRFNNSSTEFKADLRISSLKVETGSLQDVFQYSFTDRLAIMGSVNKADGTVRDVMIIGQGDETSKSALNIVMSMGILIAAVNPELSANERGNILKDLGLLGDNIDLKNLDKSTIRNGRKYHVSASDKIGIMFSVGDVSDKG